MPGPGVAGVKPGELESIDQEKAAIADPRGFEQLGAHDVEGELRRMQGASASDVEACFARAVARSHQQCATSLELRAGTSLARLWRDQGKVRQARELLAPVYGWFTEGFDTRDLRAAKKLLDELHA